MNAPKARGLASGLFLLFVLGTEVLSYGQIFPAQSGSGQFAHTNILGPVPNSGTLLIDYDFYILPDTLDVYYDGTDIFTSGLVQGAGQFVIPFGPGLETSLMIVINQEGNLATTAWTYQPTVVPEPRSLSLLALGVFGMLFRRWELLNRKMRTLTTTGSEG